MRKIVVSVDDCAVRKFCMFMELIEGVNEYDCAAEERGVAALQSGEAPSQQLKVEIAAIAESLDKNYHSGAMYDAVISDSINKLRQLSAI